MRNSVVLLTGLILLSTLAYSATASIGPLTSSGLVAYADSDKGAIMFVSSSVTSVSPSVKCTVHIEDESRQLDVKASNLYPGSSCTFQYVLRNTGSQTVSLSRAPSGTFKFSKPTLCFQYQDNLPSSLGKGHTVTVIGSISAPSSDGNSCQKTHAETHVKITATFGKQEQGSHHGEHDDDSH